MGVNLPAHLVVVKSTSQYGSSGYTEYPASSILQMIGRAGRPQYDTHATAVIMTTNANKVRGGSAPLAFLTRRNYETTKQFFGACPMNA
ncbi:hypothetical protein HAZT_HAZT001477 [Hyalella azteca]|uniref:Helicase C-terminal domain-containing protein n=1 Tax=Hyalella azteca TaxID=294128 RepID=A0A6A0GPL7_HYAAZ|nr:hypothetical protein HAZT_HAZT001477 [Hyalella azteca]